MGGGGRRLVPGKEGRNRRERLFSKERIERFLRPNMEARKRDEKCVSKGRSGCLLGSARGDRNRDDRFASMGGHGRLLGPGKERESKASGSSQGGAVDASSALEGRAENETSVSIHWGAVGASWVPTRLPKEGRSVHFKGIQWTPLQPRQGGMKARREVRLKGAQGTPPRLRQAGPKARRAVHLRRRGGRLLGAGRDRRKRPQRTINSGTDPGNGDNSPSGPVGEGSTRAEQLGMVHRDSAGPDPGSDPTPLRINPAVVDTLLAAAYEWTKCGSTL